MTRSWTAAAQLHTTLAGLMLYISQEVSAVGVLQLACIMKRRLDRVCLWGLFCTLLAFTSSKSIALNFSFTGNFVHDNDVALFTFTTDGSSDVVLKSLSYAGGVNAAGQTIPSGGFDPLLAVFDSSGALVATNDDGHALVPADPHNGQHFDVYLDLGSSLPAGTYTAALTQYDNAAVGPKLSDGFSEDGNEHFTRGLVGESSGDFWDVTDEERNAHWAFDILGAASAGGPPPPPGVPDEGASVVLLSLGIISLISARLGCADKPSVL